MNTEKERVESGEIEKKDRRSALTLMQIVEECSLLLSDVGR